MDSDFTLPPRFQFESPYLADYFGIWMVYEHPFRSIVDRCNGLNLHAHIQSSEIKSQVEERDNRVYPITKDGIAVFSINGPMMKSVPSMANGTSTVRLRQQIRSAKRDSEVLGGMLVSDTPGGTSKGNSDLSDDVAAFAAVKPIYGFIEDMTASAGVSVLSQATKRFANNATALYGAIGTYCVIQDVSGMAGQLGVKVYVVREGEFKGMGEPGTEVTAEQIKELQRVVKALNDSYLATIARGLNRTIDSIRAVADGKIIMAADAAALGLIDGVQSYETTYGQLVAAVSKKPTTRSKPTMAEKTPATLAELKSTFKNSTADWREQQIEAGSSLSEAAVNYATFVESKATEERAAHATALAAATAKAKEDATAEAKAESDKARLKSGTLGHQALTAASEGGAYDSESGDPVEDFNAAVAKKAGPNADMQKRQRAVRQVAESNPELHKAFLLASNPGKKQSRLINEKMESVGAK